MKAPFAKRSLGQNFLFDPNYRRKIADAVKASYRGGAVIEIGPGRGALTEALAGFAEKLILVEKDRAFAAELAVRFAANPNVKVVTADFMEWDGLDSLAPGGGATAVGNLPYNVSTQILIRLLMSMDKFSSLFLMFQKEVGERCAARPGGKEYGVLSVWCRLFARPEKLFDIPPNAFRPRPKVTSSLLRFEPSGTPYGREEEDVLRLAKLLFSMRRKKIATVLKARGFSWDPADDEIRELAERRPEELDVADFRRLRGALSP